MVVDIRRPHVPAGARPEDLTDDRLLLLLGDLARQDVVARPGPAPDPGLRAALAAVLADLGCSDRLASRLASAVLVDRAAEDPALQPS